MGCVFNTIESIIGFFWRTLVQRLPSKVREDGDIVAGASSRRIAMRRRPGMRAMAWIVALALPLTAPVGCKKELAPGNDAKTITLQVWGHAGREAERATIEQQIQSFNSVHEDLRCELTLLPEGAYNAQVQAAALAGELPDVLEFDGPYVYNYVWQGHLLPLDEYISSELRDNLLRSIIEQGTYRDKLWSVGQYDSGLALFARKSMLKAVEARIPPSPDDAWTVDEFESILGQLADNDDDGAVLDLKLNYRGEWFTYAFSPTLWSAGGGLINRDDYASAKDALNGAASVDAMHHIQSWILSSGYVDPNVDDYAFVGGRVALSWVGHWEYRRYADAFGDDLMLIPLPDFGDGSRTGQGSWNWGITRNCAQPRAAMRFIEHLLADENVLAMTSLNDAVPGTRSAAAKSSLHQEGGALHLYVEQLQSGHAVPRPRTPAYPVITSVFRQAFDDIRHGADVRTVLDAAAEEIDLDIRDNEGYVSMPEDGV